VELKRVGPVEGARGAPTACRRRPPRPAGRRAREVLGAPVAARAMVRAAVETTRIYVPRRRAGSAPPTDEERGSIGTAPGPILRIWCTDRGVFWRSARLIVNSRFSRIEALRAAVRQPQRSARRDGAAHDRHRPHQREVSTVYVADLGQSKISEGILKFLSDVSDRFRSRSIWIGILWAMFIIVNGMCTRYLRMHR